MLEALWSVEFSSNVNDFGAGIVVLETGRVLGGDNQYTYVGSYKINPTGEEISADVVISHYAGPGLSIFGPAKQFQVRLSGQPQRDRFTMRGQVAGRPDLLVEARFVRRSELP